MPRAIRRKCMACDNVTVNKYCSITRNNKHYRQMHREERRLLLQRWRSGRKQEIFAVCQTCSRSFKASRKTSKDCSVECYNERRVEERCNRSAAKVLHDKELARKRYINMRSSVARKLSADLRSRLNTALRQHNTRGSAVKDLGCSIIFFVQYIESLFLPGMIWQNRGVNGWHIDHIKPLASFDLTNIDQLRTACHYTNLRPLWAKDNLKKGSRC